MGAVKVAVADHRLDGGGLDAAIARRLLLQAGRTRVHITHPDAVPAFRPAPAEPTRPAARQRGTTKAEAQRLADRINAHWARHGHDAGAMAVPVYGEGGKAIVDWRVETRNLINGAPARRAPLGSSEGGAMHR